MKTVNVKRLILQIAKEKKISHKTEYVELNGKLTCHLG